DAATATGRLPTGKVPSVTPSLARNFMTVLLNWFATHTQRVDPSGATVMPSGPLPTGSVSWPFGAVCAKETLPTAKIENAAVQARIVLTRLLLIFILLCTRARRTRCRTWFPRAAADSYFAVTRVGPSASNKMDVAIQLACACPGQAAQRANGSFPNRSM